VQDVDEAAVHIVDGFLMWPLHTGDALPAVLEAVGSRHVVFLGSGGCVTFPWPRRRNT
jgi:hypothetical protein